MANTQRGLVARWQLRERGFSATTIDSWASHQRLHPLFWGVYLVGHNVEPPLARQLAAVLACGSHAYLSHRSAAELWQLVDPREGFVPQVTVVGRKLRGPRGIRVHCVTALAVDEMATCQEVPVTSPMRTLLDLASQVDRRLTERAYEEGLIRKLFTREELAAYLAKRRGRRGIRVLHAVIARDEPPSPAPGEAHKRLLRLIRASGLPHPETEVEIGPYRVDIVWADARLIVEMDGAAFHNLPSRIEADKLRDAELAARGYTVIRVTWRQLVETPTELIARISAIHRRLVTETAISTK